MALTITLNQPTSNIGDQLAKLIETIKEVNGYDGKDIIFDFNKIRFVHPFFILSVSSLMSYLKEKGYHINFINTLNSYLNLIYFPEGLKPDELFSREEAIDNYKGKTYLPILNFITSKTEEKTKIRKNVLTKINNLLENNLQFNTNYKSGISYFISEITDNIVEHAEVKRGWLAA